MIYSQGSEPEEQETSSFNDPANLRWIGYLIGAAFLLYALRRSRDRY